MKEFIRNNEAGISEVWEDGKKVGEFLTMGDSLTPDWQKAEKKEDEE